MIFHIANSQRLGYNNIVSRANRRPALLYSLCPACRKGLYADKIKAQAFAEFARRYGAKELLDCLERNEKAGVVYHREGIMGDYNEFDDLEELIRFIRTGIRKE